MIYDIVTFNGEEELFEIRYEVLKDFVDEFRVIEFDTTFSGKPKPRLFASNLPKVKSFYVERSRWSEYLELAKASPNTEYGQGASHWLIEFAQKESIRDCLDLKDDDVVFVGDVDEIWDPTQLKQILTQPQKLKLKVYSYYLNNRSTEQFWGTIVCQYRDIKDRCLNHLRTNMLPKTEKEYGWHFTSQGGYDRIKEKLTDSYTSDSYANKGVMSNLEKNIIDNKDFLGRNFEYRTDESEWPDYLKEHKDTYKHLMK